MCIFDAKLDLVGEVGEKRLELLMENLGDFRYELTQPPAPSPLPRIGTYHGELRGFGYELAQNTPPPKPPRTGTSHEELCGLMCGAYLAAKHYYFGQIVVQKIQRSRRIQSDFAYF